MLEDLDNAGFRLKYMSKILFYCDSKKLTKANKHFRDMEVQWGMMLTPTEKGFYRQKVE